MKKNQIANPFLLALQIGGIATVLSYFLGTILISPIMTGMTQGGLPITNAVYRLLQAARGLLSQLVAAIIFQKVMIKHQISWKPTFISSILAAIVIAVFSSVFTGLPAIVSTFVWLIINLIVFYCANLRLVKMINLPQNENASSGTAGPVSNSQQFTTSTQPQKAIPPENMDALSDSILKAIKPQLKAPATATLCSNDELAVTDSNGEYIVEGYVNSQNSYGAMISTDFTAIARYSNGIWLIRNTTVGVKNAKKYAKSFAVNYIAISIFVGIMVSWVI